jgi:hypothetical protein
MSYRLNIIVKNGVASIEETGGELPEGNWTIGGQEDEYGVSIHVVRRMPNGRHTCEAQHHSASKNYDDSKFEPMQDGPEIEVRQYPIHTSLLHKEPVGPTTPADGIPKNIYRGRPAHQPPTARPPYHEDIPLPEGERYPDNTCGYCDREPGSKSSDPCRYCPDVESTAPLDSLAAEPPGGYNRPGEDGLHENEDVSPASLE